MSEQIGNSAIDIAFLAVTILLFVFGVPYRVGFGRENSMVYPLYVLWVMIFIIFLISRANFSKGKDLAADDTVVRMDKLLLEPSHETSYIIPSYCPNCHEPVILEEIEWLRSDAFSCRFCGKMIQVKLEHER